MQILWAFFVPPQNLQPIKLFLLTPCSVQTVNARAQQLGNNSFHVQRFFNSCPEYPIVTANSTEHFVSVRVSNFFFPQNAAHKDAISEFIQDLMLSPKYMENWARESSQQQKNDD
jgi:hypothetical protein